MREMRVTTALEDAEEALREAEAAKKMQKNIIIVLLVLVVMIMAIGTFVKLGYSPLKVSKAKVAYANQKSISIAAFAKCEDSKSPNNTDTPECKAYAREDAKTAQLHEIYLDIKNQNSVF